MNKQGQYSDYILCDDQATSTGGPAQAAASHCYDNGPRRPWKDNSTRHSSALLNR